MTNDKPYTDPRTVTLTLSQEEARLLVSALVAEKDSVVRMMERAATSEHNAALGAKLRRVEELADKVARASFNAPTTLTHKAG